MPVASARSVTLRASERRRLKTAAYGRKTPYQDRVRAQIVLAAARGTPNARIAAQVHVTVDTVRTWRGRFADQGLEGLADRERSGRPPRFTSLQVAEVKALACELPVESGTPLSRWSCPELAREAGLLGCGQRLLPPRASRDQTPDHGVPERGHGPHPCPRLLA